MKVAVKQSDQDLLRAALGDRAAFGQFYDRHEAPLLGYLMRATGDAEVAADIAAETFAALLQTVVKRRAVEDPRAWLYAVARRKLVDAFRRGQVDDDVRRELGMRTVELTDDILDAISGLDHFDPGSAREALKSLPAEQKEAIEARVLGEYSYAEIAQTLECSEAVVRKRVSRGLERLRNDLKEREV